MITDDNPSLTFLEQRIWKVSAYRLIEVIFRIWLKAIAPELARKAYSLER